MEDEIVHGTTVALGEAGVIVFGGPGSGKTTLALALLDHHAARGVFARLVADDYTRLEVAGGRLLAAAPAPLAGRAEMRGDGIVPVASLAAVRLTHLVDLVAPAEAPRMPEEAERTAHLCGVGLARIALPARATAVTTLTVASLLRRNGLTGRRAAPHLGTAAAPGPLWRDDR